MTRRLAAALFVLLATAGCKGPGQGPGSNDSREACRERRWARYLEVVALARITAAIPPWCQPDHGVYDGLDADVARALRALNDQPKDMLWVVENDPIDVKVDGRWVTLRDSGEGAGMVCASKRQLASLGVTVAWNAQLLRYEAVR